MTRSLGILGTRGIPAKHGGFETFAEKLALYLTGKGWAVTVYCQDDGGQTVHESTWQGVRLVHIPVHQKGALATIVFDFKSVLHALSEKGLFLTLGYNTAVFNLLQRIKGQTNIFNMDGIEWRRKKWGPFAKTWFWLNERIGCWAGNHLVADHPRIKDHLATRVSTDKISTIAYGADQISFANAELLKPFGIEPFGFSVVIARPEPENSFFEMVAAFSREPRNHKLLVLGKFDPENNGYHREVIDAAGPEVLFPGAIYDAPVVQALRFFCRFYLHGHSVGGTNPSLVEALGTGCAVIAHNNQFNRWVAGPDMLYFSDEDECAVLFDTVLGDDVLVEKMKESSLERFLKYFRWEKILGEYEALLTQWYPNR